MADHRPNRYVDGEKVIYRASALGSCMKTLVAIGLGMTPEPFPTWLLERFAEGVAGEPVVLGMLGRRWRLYDQHEAHWLRWHDGQVLIELEVGSKCLVRGHADAIGQPYIGSERERKLIEVKCVTPEYAEVVLRHLPELYRWQISTYARALGLPPLLALGIKNENGEVVQVVEKPLEPVSLAAIKLRVIELEGCIADGYLPKCDYRQWPCPFPELCDDPVPDATEDWELESKLRESLVEIKGRSEEG